MINNSRTKQAIDWFKTRIPHSFNDFSARVNLVLDEYLNTHQAPYNYNELLSKLHGAFPVTLWPYFLNRGINQNLYIDNSTPEIVQSAWPLERSPKEKMAYYEWRFTQKSAKTISRTLSNGDYKKICCLGTPSIAIELSKDLKESSVSLFDINSNAITSVLSNMNSKISYIPYDVVNELSDDHLGKYDVTVINPPWYYDYYTVFILRCLQLLKNENRTIVMPLLPLLCKTNAFHEMNDLFEFLKSCGCTTIESLGVVDYITPYFEESIFLNNSIPSPKPNWRFSELVKLSFSPESVYNQIAHARSQMQPISDYIEWREFTSNDGRTLLQNKGIKYHSEKKQVLINESLISISRSARDSKRIAFWDTDKNIIFKLCSEKGVMNGS